MDNENQGFPMPRSCELVAYFNDEGLLSIKELESILGIGHRCGYVYTTRTAPTADQLRAVFHQAPQRSAIMLQSSILNFFCEGTPWTYGLRPDDPVQSEADLDTNAVFDGAIRALSQAAEILGTYRANQKMQFKLEPEEVNIMSQHLLLACRQSAAAHSALQLLARTAAPQPQTA